MRKKDIIELFITAVLIIILIFLIISGTKRVKKARRILNAGPETKTTALKQKPKVGSRAHSKKDYVKLPKKQEKDLFSRLEEEAKKFELIRDPFSRSIIKSTVMFDSRLHLSGILWDEKDPSAIINGKIVGIGDKVDSNTVVSIEQDLVVLNDGLSDFMLWLE